MGWLDYFDCNKTGCDRKDAKNWVLVKNLQVFQCQKHLEALDDALKNDPIVLRALINDNLLVGAIRANLSLDIERLTKEKQEITLELDSWVDTWNNIPDEVKA